LSARGTLTLLNNALLSAHFRLAEQPDTNQMNCWSYPKELSPAKRAALGRPLTNIKIAARGENADYCGVQ
jgi:hypothetical protein